MQWIRYFCFLLRGLWGNMNFGCLMVHLFVTALKKSISWSMYIAMTTEEKHQLMAEWRKVIETFAGWEGSTSTWLTVGLTTCLKSKEFHTHLYMDKGVWISPYPEQKEDAEKLISFLQLHGGQSRQLYFTNYWKWIRLYHGWKTLVLLSLTVTYMNYNATLYCYIIM